MFQIITIRSFTNVQCRDQAYKVKALNMATAMVKQMDQSDKIRVNFVKGSYDGRNFITSSESITIGRFESLGSFRKAMVDGVRRKINMGEVIDIGVAVFMTKSETSFIFDEMVVEDEATPMGLGMVDDDTLVFLQKNVVKYPGPNVMITIGRSKRKAKEISVGLNVLVGEAEGGLPLIGSPGLCPAPECREQLAILAALLPALQRTVDEMVASGMAPDYRPDFSKANKKLVEFYYVHARQGFKEVNDILSTFEKHMNRFSKEGGRRGEEGSRSQQLWTKISFTMAEFIMDTGPPPACKDEENNIVYYVGLARNCTALNYLSCPPTVHLKGVSSNTTFQELATAWITYVKNETNSPHLEGVSYDNVRYEFSEGVKVADLVCPGLMKYYFCLDIVPGLRKHYLNVSSSNNNQHNNQDQQEEDDRDINQLLEFIEGDDGKEQDKKKKRKKKKKGKEAAGLLAEAETVDAEAEAIHTGSEALGGLADSFEANAEGEKAQHENALQAKAQQTKANKEEAEEAKASKAKHQAKDTKDICHVGGSSDTLGGCKKKVKSKQRKADEKLNESIAQKEAMLEERRRYAESIIESKSKEMKKLITGFEEAEDHKAAKLKEVADIDARMEELKTARARLLVECEAKDEVMNKFNKKRMKLEEFITSQINKYKSETSQLETEVKDLKMKQLKHDEEEVFFSDEEKASSGVKTVETPNLQLLDFIDQKIEAKEEELECPVCLEVASVPIFMCDEQHLICSSCRPKVGWMLLHA